MTTAQTVCKTMGDDGQRWTSSDGRSLEHICRDAGARIEGRGNGDWRALFSDGSSIVAAGDGWDVGYGDSCWCWQGADHRDNCGGEIECIYCGATVRNEPVPLGSDDEAWQRIAHAHGRDCEWAQTRAHREAADAT